MYYYIFRLRMLQNYEQEDAFGFIVRLCHDVFLEVLIFGDRRRLTKLERVGRRFHLCIENFFREKPFLRLGLRIDAYLFIVSLKFIRLRLESSAFTDSIFSIIFFIRV